MQLHLGRLLLAVLNEHSTGPLLSGAVRRPCCCALLLCFGCRLSALRHRVPSSVWLCSQCLRRCLPALCFRVLCFRVLSGGPVAAVLFWVPFAGPFNCTWRRAWFYSQCFRDTGNCKSTEQFGLPGGHHFGQHSVQRGVCQCACWWWLSHPKRVCQWSLKRDYFLLEVLALEDMGALFLRFL